MANNLLKKPFLDYQAQIKYLKQKQLVINDEASATTALEKVSYYGLINGYKDIFKDPATRSFYPGTTLDDIYNLYLFDAELRDVFLKSSEISPCSPPYHPNAIRTSFSNDCANLSSSSSVRFLGPLI